MATTLTSTTPPPSKPENLLDMVFSYDNTIMLASIISLLIVILFVLLLHLYARWFLTHHNNLPPLRRHHLSMTYTTYEISPAPKEPGFDGLDSFIIESIPTFICNKETPTMECAICLSEFEEDEVGRTLPRCSHAFHVECIDTWLRDHSTCPVCRLGLVGDLCKDECSKDDVVLEIDGNESDYVQSSSENVSFERLMRTAVSRSCRSDVVMGNRRSDRARPSI